MFLLLSASFVAFAMERMHLTWWIYVRAKRLEFNRWQKFVHAEVWCSCKDWTWTVIRQVFFSYAIVSASHLYCGTICSNTIFHISYGICFKLLFNTPRRSKNMSCAMDSIADHIYMALLLYQNHFFLCSDHPVWLVSAQLRIGIICQQTIALLLFSRYLHPWGFYMIEGATGNNIRRMFLFVCL
jgi:hypothetical protein